MFGAAVKYHFILGDGTVIAKTPEEGIEFYVKDGNFAKHRVFLHEFL